MSEKQNEKQGTSKSEPKPEPKKQPETVNLSAEELRKISGGALANTKVPSPQH